MIIETSEIVLLSFCFLGSAFFSGSEAVLMSVGIDRAKQLIESGGVRGAAMTFMVEKPNELLTTILVGNNITNIFAASLTTAIVHRQFQDDAVSIATGVTTLFILIFGEIIPKTFARSQAEFLSVFVIRVLQLCYYLMFPFVILMTWFIERLLGKSAHIRGSIVTKNDLEYMVSKAEKERTMDSKQLEMISSVLEFPTIKVKDIMIPRSRVQFIKREMSVPEVLEIINEDNYSRYPVCDGDLDQTLGFLHVKDLAFVNEEDRKSFHIENILKDPFFVYEHMKIQAVFDHMNRKRVHLALVKDESGLVVGIITLEDIVEEILGDIIDEHDEDELIQEARDEVRNGEGFHVEADISLRDLNSEYDINIPSNDNFSTVAGFLLNILGDHFPKKGQLIFWDNFSFELAEVEDATIKEVIIKYRGEEERPDQEKSQENARSSRKGEATEGV